MISFTYFTSQINLNSNQNIASLCPSGPQAEVSHKSQTMFTLVVIVDLIYFNQKTFSLLDLAKLLFF